MSTTFNERPLRCGVVGVGRMGTHHARAFARLDETELVAIADADQGRCKDLADELGVNAVADVEALLELELDAVTVAVPTKHHHDVARPLLEAGIACLIEKPLAPNVEEAEQIARIADETGTILQVGHIERYNPAVRALADEQNRLVPRFIEVHRVSPMSFRSVDVGVVLDMMIHDLDVLLMLTGAEPEHIDAVAVAVLGAGEDVCNARLVFPDGCVANVTTSRLALKTERKIRVIAEDAYISINYANKSGMMIRKTANQEQLDTLRQDLASGEDLSDVDYMSLVNVEPLRVDQEDQLETQIRDFVRAIRTGGRPTVDVHAGFAAVRTAERIVDAARSHLERLRDPDPV